MRVNNNRLEYISDKIRNTNILYFGYNEEGEKKQIEQNENLKKNIIEFINKFAILEKPINSLSELHNLKKLTIDINDEFKKLYYTEQYLFENLINIEKLEILGKSNELFYVLNELVELNKLKKLTLSYNNIYFDNGIDVLYNLPLLEELNIKTNHNINKIFKSLKILKYIKTDWRLDNKMPKDIGNIKFLNEFYFDGERTKVISKSIGDLFTLKKLHLKCPYLKNLPDEIGNLKYLKILKIESDSLKDLPETIDKLYYLEELYIENNNYNRREFKLPNSIGNLKNLKKLHIGSYCNKLPNSICDLKELEELYLKFDTKLPNDIGKLKNLKKLTIVESTDINYYWVNSSIPKSIIEIPNLTINYENKDFHKLYNSMIDWEKTKQIDTVDAYKKFYLKYGDRYRECSEAIKNKSFIEYIKFMI